MMTDPRRPGSWLAYNLTGKRHHSGIHGWYDGTTYYTRLTVIGSTGTGTQYDAVATAAGGDIVETTVTGTPSTTFFSDAATLQELVESCLALTSGSDTTPLGSLGAKEKGDWVDFRLAPAAIGLGDTDSPYVETPYSYVHLKRNSAAFEFGIQIVVDWLEMIVTPTMAFAPCKLDYKTAWGYFVDDGDGPLKDSVLDEVSASANLDGNGSGPLMPLLPSSGADLLNSGGDSHGGTPDDAAGVWTWFGLSEVKITVPF
jgi:hypothetical protein